MKADMRIEGVDALRRRLGAASRTIDRELRPEIRAGAIIVRDDARGRIQSKVFKPSIQYRILPGGLTAIIGSAAKTALSIHQGRHPGEIVRVGLILAWMRRYGISASSGLGRRGLAAARSRAADIVVEIRARGTRPIPFLLPAAVASRDRVQRRVRDGVGRALQQIARGA